MRIWNEKGAATLELALVAPVLMVLVLGVLQFGIWYHAQQVAITAAQEGSRKAAAELGSANDGETVALEVLRAGLGRATQEETATVRINAEFVQAVVTARIRGLLPIPGLTTFQLEARASAYREGFRPEGNP